MPVDPVAVEHRVAPTDLTARSEPRKTAPASGIVAAGEAFAVFGHVPAAAGCADWGRVDRDAFVCLDTTTTTDAVPSHLPRVDPGALPYVYARLGRGRPGFTYASLSAYEAGARPVDRFERDHSYHFVGIEPSAKGEVLVAADGRVVPVAQADVYTPSVFAGRDLEADPLPAGSSLGWCVDVAGCTAADGTAYVFQEAFVFVDPPTSGTYRRWVPLPRPEGVAEGTVWLDVHLAEQTLAVYRGDTPLRATLVSAGVGGRYATPKGTFHIQDKVVENDMISLPGAEDVYHVERVPWVAHFRPRFALHGAYWHGRFGLPASHGCINLAPADAHVVFDLLHPVLPDGWRLAWATEADPGTLLHVW